MRCLLLIVAVAASLSAQPTNPPIVPFSQLRAYLGLSDSQFQGFVQSNNEYSTFLNQKQARVAQVQREIAELTAASPLDPQGLGLRYAELETICRQQRDKAEEIGRRNRATLTDAQKVKMAALEEAVKLLPIYNEAQAMGLTGQSAGSLILGGVTRWFDTASFLLGTIGPALPGCANVPTTAVRTGDFTSLP